MEVFGDEQQLCPCYDECQEFQKLVELKDSSLVVYCHRPHTEDIRQAEAVESAVNTSRDVFILYNKKNVKVTTSELTSELEKENISCPRCRKIFEHAQKLIQEVKSIDKKMLMGICDHCRKKAQGSKKPFCVCDKIVKKFISVKDEQKEDTKKSFKTLPLIMEYLRKDTMVNKENQNAYVDFQINRGLNSSASRHEPEVQQMFSHTHFKSGYTELGKIDLKEGYVKPAVAFIQPIKPVITSSAHTPHEGENINTIIPDTWFVDSETTLVETSVGLKELPRPSLKDRKQGEIFEDRPEMDAKEASKRRHDLSLRQMMRHEKDAGVPYSVSKRPHIYETPKIAPWAQKDPTSKYYAESEMDKKISTLKHDRGPRGLRGTPDLDYVSNRDVKFRSTRASQDSFIAPKKADKYHHDKIKQGLYDSEEGLKKVKKLEDRHIVDEELKLKRSVDKISQKTKKPEQHVAKSKSEPFDSMRNVIEHQYSYFFPKVMEKEEKKTIIDVSSSQLIKYTQEKFLLQAEREKKRQEEQRQKNLERTQKKKHDREEKKKQEEEQRQRKLEQAQKKKLDLEEKKRQEEEKRQKKLDQAQKKKLDLKEKKRQEEEQRQRKLEQAQKKKLVREEKILQAEDKKGQPIEDQKKYEEEQRKLEEEHQKLAKQKYSEKEHKEKGKISKEPLVATKNVMPKPYHREVSEKAETEVKQEDKGVAKDQKIKPEKEDRDETLQREKTDNENLKKQAEQLPKEKEARKAQAAKELDALSEKGKASIKTKFASDAAVDSLSKIQESLKTDKFGKQNTLIVKLEKEQESKAKTFKIEPSIIEKLKNAHLKENLKQNQQLKYEEAERNAQKVVVNKKDIKMIEELCDAHLQLVLLKQTAKMGHSIQSMVLEIHESKHQHSENKSSLSTNSDLELEEKNLTTDKKDIIIGEKICTYKPSLEKNQEPEGVPILFQKEFCVEPDQQLKQIVQIIPQETKPEQKRTEMEQGTGVIHYALSDRTFIDKGWTMLPTEKVMQKKNVYRMRPAHPEFDWFEHNKNKRLMTYDTGERLAEFDDNGRGRWYYRSGRLALDYYDAEETNVQQRFVIYSSGKPNERGRTHPITILATFDHQGNGIVLDHAGKIRLKYNQTEGVLLDRGIGPVSHWKWHSLNDPPVLLQVMIDTQMAFKDPNILKLEEPADDQTRPRRDNDEMLAIEFDNFIKEKCKKLSRKFKPFEIRMKALKINEHFSLKILDQATVYLIFRDGSTNLKLNIGMILDDKEIVDIDTAEVGEVSSNLERFPARSDSLAGLQRSVAHAQRYQRQHVERERRLRLPQPCASADQLTAAASPPMRLPLRTVPTRSSSSIGCSSRKPTNNLYYDTRLRC